MKKISSEYEKIGFISFLHTHALKNLSLEEIIITTCFIFTLVEKISKFVNILFKIE